MMRKLALACFSFGAVGVCFFWIWGTVGGTILYRSTERYCIRIQSERGRIGLTYDGGLDVIGPFQSSFNHAGIEFNARVVTGWSKWQEIAASAPAWMLALSFAVFPLGCLGRIAAQGYFRRRRGLCARCGYNLARNTSGVCPECGSQVTQS